jgi:hypothetical protein
VREFCDSPIVSPIEQSFLVTSVFGHSLSRFGRVVTFFLNQRQRVVQAIICAQEHYVKVTVAILFFTTPRSICIQCSYKPQAANERN